MTMQRRIKIDHADLFPAGAYLKGAIEPVMDFNAPKRADGSRPQQVDKDTGLLLWQATVLDADEEAGKKDTALSVKFAAKVRPVPPENTSGLPWTPVEFTGLTALAYVEYTGGKDPEGHDRTRIAWSFRAEGIVAPGGSTKSTVKSEPRAVA
jgi:hypothetical protein